MNAMKLIFKTFFLSLTIVAQVHFAYAQTASILPPAKTTFLDNNGKPLAKGKVYFYIPGTTTAKTTWQDSGETTPNTNPVNLDTSGRAIILGDGTYRQQVFDSKNNLIWDLQTSSTGSGGGGSTPTVGDGDAVGTVKPWAGFTAPNQYVFSYGQELARASFPELLAAITSQQNVSCTSSSTTLTGLTDTSQIPIGAPVESICVNAGTTVVSKTISTLVVSAAAIITTNTSIRIFPFGNGDGSTTFNTPDLRGRVIAGRDNMGGVAANRLTSTYFGSSASAINATGGNESNTLVNANLPPYTPSGTNGTVSVTSVSSGIQNNTSGTINAQTGGVSNVAITNSLAVNSTGAGPTFTGVAQGGTSTPFRTVQPTDTLNWIIKTLPDTNPNSFFGVASLGGMTGVITCGFGITCAGNSISAISSVVPAPTPTTLGGVFLASCSSHNWFNLVDNTGTFGCSQPSFSDITGTVSLASGGTNASLTASNGGVVWSNATQLQILAGTATARLPLLSGSTAAPVWGAYSLPASITSGGVACFTSTSAMVSSALLTANAIMLGGGSGVCPSTLGSLGTTTTVLHGNAAGAPTFGQIVGSDIATNTIANSNLAQVAASTLKGNPTGSLANEQGITLGSTLGFSGTTLNCTTGTTSQLGCLKPDGTTISVASGVITAVGSSATSITDGTTTIVSGSNGSILSNNAGVLSHVTRAAPNHCTIISTSATTCNNGGSVSANNGTYTPTAGILYFKIRMVGGGASAAGSGSAGAGNGNNGNSSTFNTTTTAPGGTASLAAGAAGGAGGVAGANCDFTLAGGAGQPADQLIATPPGATGGGSFYSQGGGPGIPSAQTGQTPAANTGAGGGGAGPQSGVAATGGAGAGAYCEKVFTSPSGTYAYTVGAAVAGGTAGTSGGVGGGGAAGNIQIDEYYN